MTLRSRTFLALCTGLLAGFASAQNITDVTSSNDPDVGTPPVQASVGSELTIDGSGFGSTKPKVFLTNEVGKKFSLKVTAFGDGQVKATITKAVAGELTLNVLPKGAAEPATAAVSLEAPQIGELMDAAMQDTITSADPNVEFAISGHFFGIKKGKVKIGTKAAKVLSWADDMVHVVMPKTLPTGSFFINLDNKLAADADQPVGVTNSPVKLGNAIVHLNAGPDHVTLHLGGGLGNFQLPDTAGYATVVAATTGGLHPRVLVLAADFVDGGAVPYTAVVGGSGALIGEYINVGKIDLQHPLDGGIKLYFPADGFSVTINSNSGGQVAGSFTGTMHSLIQGVDDVLVDGDFVIDLTDLGP